MKPVSELFKIYLSCGAYADSTIESKRIAMGFFINKLDDLDIDKVTYGHAEDYQKILWQGGRVAKTVNLYVIHLSHFFEWTIKHKYVQDNPFFGLKSLPEQINKRPRFTDEELTRMLEVANIYWTNLICLGSLGLRRGESLNLVVRDIHFDEGYILITPKKDTAETWRWGIKNRTQAYAPLPEFIMLLGKMIKFQANLCKLIELLPQRQPYVSIPPGYFQRLMKSHREGILHHRKRKCPWGNFDRDFKALLKRACVSPKSFHDLRRTFAHKLKLAGYDLKETQTLMRHKSIQTTAEYYVNIDEQELVSNVNGTFEDNQTYVP